VWAAGDPPGPVRTPDPGADRTAGGIAAADRTAGGIPAAGPDGSRAAGRDGPRAAGRDGPRAAGRDGPPATEPGPPPRCERQFADVATFRTALASAPTGTICLLGSAARPAAARAVRFALGQIGTPYRWAGNGPADGGYDCSGLTSASYARAGVRLPRTAQAQYNAGPRLPAGRRILPGDLVFFGSGPRSVTHVGVAVSSMMMINAPQSGETVKIAPIRRRDFVGASRPAPLDLR
jgi:cell wall-associated NlpC family hydrolase